VIKIKLGKFVFLLIFKRNWSLKISYQGFAY